MSMLSELKKRGGPRVKVMAAPSGRSDSGGERVELILMPPTSGRLGDVFEIAHLLVHAGVSVRTAKKTIESLASGRTAYVEAPAVSDYEDFKQSMMNLNVAVHRIEKRTVDVKALRARLGISQEAFAGRYGLDIKTLQNWEQGRTKPEGPAAILLQLIERDPEKVVELLVS
jgi:DNA-binding transcriptional regulator YiaG